VFVAMPIGMNLLLTLYIIKQEYTRDRFYQWLTANGKTASVFIVLSGVDIKVLNILHSNLLNLVGFPLFNAPFSDSAKSKIFWGVFLSIIIRDIPQIIIQVRI
jgi:hypothetical protein